MSCQKKIKYTQRCMRSMRNVSRKMRERERERRTFRPHAPHSESEYRMKILHTIFRVEFSVSLLNRIGTYALSERSSSSSAAAAKPSEDAESSRAEQSSVSRRARRGAHIGVRQKSVVCSVV